MQFEWPWEWEVGACSKKRVQVSWVGGGSGAGMFLPQLGASYLRFSAQGPAVPEWGPQVGPVFPVVFLVPGMKKALMLMCATDVGTAACSF